ncbi:uL15 family ribosomal protein [Patescibacteria group bacterium]
MAPKELSLGGLSKRHQSKKQRSGRGSSSRRGNYAGRGLKGQRSRSGGRQGNLRRSLKHLISRVPKRRGFSSMAPAKQTVNIAKIDILLPDFDKVIDLKVLKENSLIRSTRRGVKVVGQVKLKRAFTIKAHGFSQQADKAIKAAGGRTILIVSTKKKIAAKNKK